MNRVFFHLRNGLNVNAMARVFAWSPFFSRFLAHWIFNIQANYFLTRPSF